MHEQLALTGGRSLIRLLYPQNWWDFYISAILIMSEDNSGACRWQLLTSWCVSRASAWSRKATCLRYKTARNVVEYVLVYIPLRQKNRTQPYVKYAVFA